MINLRPFTQIKLVRILNAVSYLGVILLILLAVKQQVDNHALLNSVNNISRQNTQLIEQTVKLGEDNRKLAQDNKDYIRCLATLFATFTEKRVPVKLQDIDSCNIVTIQPQPQQENKSQPTTPNSAPKQPPADNKQSDNRQNPDPPEPPEPPKSIIERVQGRIGQTIDNILGVNKSK